MDDTFNFCKNQRVKIKFAFRLDFLGSIAQLQDLCLKSDFIIRALGCVAEHGKRFHQDILNIVIFIIVKNLQFCLDYQASLISIGSFS